MAAFDTGPKSPPIEVRNSSVHGSGVFATRAIKKGERIIEYLGERVFIDAMRDIASGEELTYDYQIYRDWDDPENIDQVFACRCGSPKCRGTMLWPPEPKKKVKARKKKAVVKKKIVKKKKKKGRGR